MAKELALIAARNERNKKKKKEENKLQLQAPVNAITNTINKTVGKPQNKKTTVNKTTTQSTTQKTQTNTLQRSSNVKEMPTFSPKDNRTVKTTQQPKKKSVQTFDVYERGGKYFYEENGKEVPIKTKYLKNAIKNKRSGVIGNFDEKGNFQETNSRGVPLKQTKEYKEEKAKKQAETINKLNKATDKALDYLMPWRAVQKKGKEAVNLAKETYKSYKKTKNDLKQGKVTKQELKDQAIVGLANSIENSPQYKNLKTVGNIATNMGKGAIKNIESVLDFANVVSNRINNPLEQKAKVGLGLRTEEEAQKEREEAERQQAEWAARNLTQEALNKVGWNEDVQNQWEDGSLVKESNKGGEIAQGIGGMVPSLYATKLLGIGNVANASLKGLRGTALLKGIGRNVGTGILSNAGGNAVLGASAYGSGYEEALNQGATPEQARRYATLNAGTEFATEMITGGIPGLKQTGILDNMADGLIDKATGKVTNKFLKQATSALMKMGYTGLGEGFEEGLADIINPMIKNATYTDGETINWNDVWRDAFVGGAIGLALGGGNAALEGIDIANQQIANQQIQQLNTLADQRIQEIQQEVAQNPELAQAGTQEIQDIQNYVRAQENIIENQAQTQAQEGETTQPSTNTQETQNVVQNKQKEGTQESTFNNETKDKNIKIVDNKPITTNKEAYNSEPKAGTIRLYTNTSAENIDSILKNGLDVSKAKQNEYEGNMTWFETRPDLKGYGGTTIAVDVPLNSNMDKVNDTQYTVYDNISPKNITFVDRPVMNNYRTSDIEELLNKYGEEKTTKVFDRALENGKAFITKDEFNNIIKTINANKNVGTNQIDNIEKANYNELYDNRRNERNNGLLNRTENKETNSNRYNGTVEQSTKENSNVKSNSSDASYDRKGTYRILRDNNSNGRIKFTRDGLENIINESVNDNNPKEAKYFLARIHPRDFLKLTSKNETINNIIKETNTNLDINKLDGADKNGTNQGKIMLNVDMETGQIKDHNGRHRMVKLAQNGVDEVDIVIYNTNNNKSMDFKYNSKVLEGQEDVFKGEEYIPKEKLFDVYPVNKENIDKIRKIYGEGLDNSSFSNEQSNLKNNEQPQTQQQEQNNRPEILDKMPTEKKSTIKSLKKGIDTFRKEITDRFAAVYDMAQKTRNKTLYHKADRILASDGMAQVDIDTNQVNLNGKPYKNFTDENSNKVSMSLEQAYDIYNKIPNKDKNTFLVNQLNIDRLNQGVDQFEIPMEDSERTIAQLREKYPDIDKWSENIYQYYRNLQDKMVESGRVSQELADKWRTETPHYVHIQRDVQNKGNTGVSVKNGKIDSDNLIRKVKGGNYAILPIKDTTAKFTQNVTRAITYNDFGKEYARTIGYDSQGNNATETIDLDEMFGLDPEFVNNDGNGNYTMKLYENGGIIEVPISEDVYKSLSPQNIPRVGVLAEATTLYKDLLTNKNPFFGFLRNPIKDVQDMFLYSKHPLYKSVSTYTKLFAGRTALRNRVITKDGVTAQDIVDFYHNTGNAVHSIYKNGQFDSKNKVKESVDKVLSPIEKGNDFMESMPRITEFWNTIQKEGYTLKDGELVAQKGKKPSKTVEQVIAEASYYAADVTVNFKRGGRTSKAISQNGGIFFNPSVQGASKFVRNITEAVSDAKSGDFRAAKLLVARAAMLGIAPAILSEIMYGDDDEYKDIQDYQKDQYYIIKGEDGKWIRIPKGRAISLFQSATRRSIEKSQGRKDAFKGYGQLIGNQIAPNNPLDNNIFSPITSAITNTSWSGNKIVSDSMAKRPVEEQFNEKTDEFSKWIGKKLHISPMKVNYVIDQYSGVLGDLALPQITPKATTGSSNPIMNILRDNYSFDAANSSKSLNDFYEIKSKVQTKARGMNATDKDKIQSKYLGTQSQEMYNLYTEKQKIQMDNSLSKKEKYDQALEVQKKINKKAKDAIKGSKDIDINKNYATVGDNTYYKDSGDWKKESEKTTQRREELGLTADKYYYYRNEESYTTPDGYNKYITSGKNAKRNMAIVDAFNFDTSDYLEYSYKLNEIKAGSKTKSERIKYVNSLPLSDVQKAYLLKTKYKTFKNYDSKIAKEINKSNLSKKEKEEIYSYLGLGG